MGRNNTRTATCSTSFEIAEIGKEVTFEAEASYGNHGIGQYEFWGQKCNDIQMGYEMSSEIYWDISLYTVDENRIIEEWLDKNMEKVEKDLMESISDPYEDDGNYDDYRESKDEL